MLIYKHQPPFPAHFGCSFWSLVTALITALMTSSRALLNINILLVLAAILLLSGCNKDRVKKQTLWDTYKEPTTAKKLPADSGVKELSLLWKDDIGTSSENGFARIQPIFSGESIYVANRAGEVFRKNAHDGKTIWTTDLDLAIFSGVSVDDKIAVVAHDNGTVSALNLADGSVAWSHSVKRQFSAIPVVANGRVIIRSADGLIIGLKSDNGESVWQVRNQVPALTMQGDSMPAVIGDAVLIGLSNGKIIANDLITGRNYWEAEIGFGSGQNELERLNDSDTNPIVQGTTVYTASYQGNVIALQLHSAEVMWTRDISTRLPMALSARSLIVIGDLGDIFSLSTIDGSVLWEQGIFRGHGVTYPVVVGERVIIGDANGNVHTLALDSGALVQSREIVSGAVIGLISDNNNNRIGVLSSKGKLVALSL